MATVYLCKIGLLELESLYLFFILWFLKATDPVLRKTTALLCCVRRHTLSIFAFKSDVILSFKYTSLFQLKRRVVTIDGYVDVSPNEEALLKAVAAQPVSVGICGSERAFQLYSKVVSCASGYLRLKKLNF